MKKYIVEGFYEPYQAEVVTVNGKDVILYSNGTTLKVDERIKLFDNKEDAREYRQRRFAAIDPKDVKEYLEYLEDYDYDTFLKVVPKDYTDDDIYRTDEVVEIIKDAFSGVITTIDNSFQLKDVRNYNREDETFLVKDDEEWHTPTDFSSLVLRAFFNNKRYNKR